MYYFILKRETENFGYETFLAQTENKDSFTTLKTADSSTSYENIEWTTHPLFINEEDIVFSTECIIDANEVSQELNEMQKKKIEKIQFLIEQLEYEKEERINHWNSQ